MMALNTHNTTNKTDRRDITEVLLKVTLSTITHPPYYIVGWILSRLLLSFTLSKADISKNEKFHFGILDLRRLITSLVS
jgi:hypothetical protein